MALYALQYSPCVVLKDQPKQFRKRIAIRRVRPQNRRGMLAPGDLFWRQLACNATLLTQNFRHIRRRKRIQRNRGICIFLCHYC